MANFFDQFDTEQKQTGNFFDRFDAGKPVSLTPTESGGFFGSFKEALGERIETAKPAAQLLFGVGDQTEATQKLLQANAEQEYKQTEFSEIGEAFREGKYGDALGKTLDKFKEVAGSSFGSMAPAMGAGAAGALGAGALGVAAAPAVLIGTAAYGLTALGSYIADNISRQKAEQAKQGREAEDINRLTATTAAAGQTALDIFGFKFFKPLGRLVGVEGKEAAEKAALELVQAATNPNAYSKAVARGAATGIAFEVPQEVAQQALERWQAGLPLDPFRDPEAAKEYLEAAGGALLLGGPMGAYSRTAQTYQARQTPEGQALLRTKSPEWVREAFEEVSPDVAGTEQGRDRRGAAVPAQPADELSTTGEAEAPKRSGVVLTGEDATRPAGREGTAPPSVTSEQVDDFTRQYNELRAEYAELAGERNPTDATTRRMQQVGKDLNDVINANTSWLGRDADTLERLRNPLYDGNKDISALAQTSVSEPKAMQGTLFGGAASVKRAADLAMAEAGQDPAKAVKALEQRRQRILARQQAGDYSDSWAMNLATKYGMSRGDAVTNKAQIIESEVQEQLKTIDSAIEQLQRAPKAMQGDMFGAEGTDKATQERMEMLLRWREIEKRSRKQVEQQAGESTSPQELVKIYSAEKNRLTRALEQARADLENLQQRASSQQIGGKPTAQTIDEARALIASLERSLQGTNTELQNAQFDVDEGVTRPKIKKPAPVESSTDKQEPLFDSESEGKIKPVEKAEPTEKAPTKKVKDLSDLDQLFDLGPVDESTMTEEEAALAAEQEDRRRQAKEKVQAPLISTEHVAQTEEGQKIKSFFDAIKPATDTAGEVEKHSALRNVGANTMLEFDIVQPGETTSPGIRAMLDYLARRVGGTEKLDALIGRMQQGTVTGRELMIAGLPDLTTRRGMEEFNNQIKAHVDLLASRGLRVQVPAGKTPYVSGATTVRTTTRTYEPTKEGKPRRPTTLQEEREYKIADPKLRSSWNLIKQIIAARGKITPGMLAAKNYIENPNRKSFGEVLADLAFDVAYYEAFPDEHGANATFYGEGGKYAMDFKGWIEQNLSPDTVDVLNNMIDDYRSNIKENEKYQTAIAEYQSKLKTYADNRRKQAEKTSGVKIPKSPEKLEQEREARIEKNLPRIMMLPDVHPAIIRLLEKGDVNLALELMAEAKGNKYYAALAQRLLDAGLTATSKIIGTDELISLSNDPKVRETFNNQLSTLAEMLRVADPQNENIADLESDNRRRIGRALENLQGKGEPAQNQIVEQALNMLNKQFNWVGRYDPASDQIMLRQGSLTNHLFLHESLHAATLELIDNPQALQGVRRQGYDQLLKLYNHAKGILAQDGISDGEIYGLEDLHEFVSEAMTNPEFQALLRNIRYQAAPFSLWNAFTRSISKLFGVSEGSTESNVMVEVMKATDALMANSKMTGLEGMTVKGEPKAARRPRVRTTPPGMRNQPSSVRQLMTSRNWGQARGGFSTLYNSAKATARPTLLGALTLRQIGDLVNNRIPQINNFIKTTEAFLARKNAILQESGEVSKRWERMQGKDPEMSRKLATVMHTATIEEFDPDPNVASTPAQRAANAALINEWRALSPEAKQIYREVRSFYERRYSEYKRLMNRRIMQMRQLGVSEQTILEIRNEFEQGAMKGPYFPLMRHGRFWYQVGKGKNREYYMFESRGQMEAHQRANPRINEKSAEGSEYKEQMSLHARESNFLRTTFRAIDDADIQNPAMKQELKDSMYQTFLSNQPERSFRTQFMHRNNVAGYSEDALRNFAASSFHMAYQLARFEHAPNLFSQLEAAREQLKGRFRPGQGQDIELSRENNELSDYITEVQRRMNLMLEPTDVGTIPSTLSNIGFIWYLSAPASAITNVLGGMIIGLPTLIGQYVKLNPGASYTSATLKMLGQMRTLAGQIMATGFKLDTSGRIPSIEFPSLNRAGLRGADLAAYNRFAADGIIDITATYDLSGLSASPTESYTGVRHRTMQALASLFHNAERFNREIMAMSAFRTAMDKRRNYTNQQKAFAESIAEAKDVTQRAMFDYSTPNKPRYFQHPVARVILQFKQFPQQMTFFLTHNFVNMFKGASPEVRREARARFVGTMGMAGIFSGVTGLWGFSTVASIVNAVINGMADDDEEPFDFEIEFANWAVDTFGKNVGTMLTRGIGNAAGLDIASRTKLDDMWFRDGRNNQDEVEALRTFLVDLLGPTIGLAVNAAEAVKLFNTGHADRALEMISPAFIKNPLVAARYSEEGVQTLRGDPLMEEVGPFYLLMQSLGLRSAELAERQFYNITVKGFEQETLKERQNLLNLYGVAFMSGDFDAFEKAMEKIDKFNERNPSAFIPFNSLNKSIGNRLDKSTQTDHGLFIDKRLRSVLDQYSYME